MTSDAIGSSGKQLVPKYFPPTEHEWVVHWEDHHETFPDFHTAKSDLLDFLWFYSREFIDGAPDFSDRVMVAWDQVSAWKENWGLNHMHVFIDEQPYGLTRRDVWDGEQP